MKKYIDIERYKQKYDKMFSIGENIVIQEKIDGANASFKVENGQLVCFSRNTQLSSNNTLRGFYDFMQLKADKIVGTFSERFIVFGEWLVAHKVKYPSDRLNNFYVFDVYNTETEEFMPWECVKNFAFWLGLDTVPCFYEGEFTSWEEVTKFIGKSEVNASPCGEGIVIKSQDRFTEVEHKPYCIKIVSEKFSEIQKTKPVKVMTPEERAKEENIEALTKSVVTERRVEKMLDKMVDEGIIPVDWDEKSMGIIAKNINRRIYEDCIKEEPETVAQIENFGKRCGKITMEWVKEILKKR